MVCTDLPLAEVKIWLLIKNMSKENSPWMPLGNDAKEELIYHLQDGDQV